MGLLFEKKNNQKGKGKRPFRKFSIIFPATYGLFFLQPFYNVSGVFGSSSAKM